LKLLDRSLYLIQLYAQTEVHCTRNLWKKLVMPCKMLKLTNQQCFGRLQCTR